jgi:hypothetical protein
MRESTDGKRLSVVWIQWIECRFSNLIFVMLELAVEVFSNIDTVKPFDRNYLRNYNRHGFRVKQLTVNTHHGGFNLPQTFDATV